LFHSILYLCIMNMLEQLARLVLPKEILDNFDIVKIETDESDIDSMSMTIYLYERMNGLRGKVLGMFFCFIVFCIFAL
jgi:hypothetical protein